MLQKSDKIPKGKLLDKSLLAPFQGIHIDFSFFGHVHLGIYIIIRHLLWVNIISFLHSIERKESTLRSDIIYYKDITESRIPNQLFPS
jgi:hypothetical protein